MNTTVRLAAVGLAAFAVAACNKAENRDLKTQKDKVSYIIGQNIGRSFKQQGLSADLVDLSRLRAGIADGIAGTPNPLSEEQIAEIMSAFQREIMARADSVNDAQGGANRTAGEEFLAKNAQEEGVVVLPSGLQYKVIEQGKGRKPGLTSMVTVHYTGTLIDGKEFDSSHKRGQPTTFPVNGVIAGWTEALQLMPVGSKWKLFIPSDLAYGEQAAGPEIGPNSTLIFEVELISIND